MSSECNNIGMPTRYINWYNNNSGTNGMVLIKQYLIGFKTMKLIPQLTVNEAKNPRS